MQCWLGTRFCLWFFFFQAEDGIRDDLVTGVQTCALPISPPRAVPGELVGAVAQRGAEIRAAAHGRVGAIGGDDQVIAVDAGDSAFVFWRDAEDRKSTRLNSSHQIISYAVFCFQKKISTQR